MIWLRSPKTTPLLSNGVATTYSLTVADQVEELASRELSCCRSWLNIATERHDDGLRLALTTTNPEGLAVIMEMSGYAALLKK